MAWAATICCLQDCQNIFKRKYKIRLIFGFLLDRGGVDTLYTNICVHRIATFDILACLHYACVNSENRRERDNYETTATKNYRLSKKNNKKYNL